MNQLETVKQMLLSGEYTCVLGNKENVYTSTLRGVRPLVKLLEDGNEYNGYFAADKVVGKATAFLYVLLGVKALYAHIISRPALQVLNEHGIETEYTTLTDNIINRNRDGICPFESAVLAIDDPDAAYAAIRNQMKLMNIDIEE